jgi:hypothetical protein
MKEYYMLLSLNQKEVKIIDVKGNNGIIEVSIENKDRKVRCPKCDKFASSVHRRNKPIHKSVLDILPSRKKEYLIKLYVL